MAESLLLGPVTFAGFELPARIGFGGAQRLTVHRLPGGARVVDAMGPDNAEIGWSGTFTGADAAERARSLDLLRAGGLPWPLVWDSFAYLVSIAQFEAQYQRAGWVPYRIACLVVQDLTQTLAGTATDLASGLVASGLLASGLVASGLLASGLLADLAAAGAPASLALAALTAPGATASGATAPGSAAYAAALASLGAAQAGIAGGMASAGSALLASGDPAAAAASAGTLAQLADARGYVGRALSNLTDLEI